MDVGITFTHPRFPELAEAMLGRLDSIADAVLARSRRELPAIWTDPSLEPAISDFARASMRAELECLCDLGRIPEEMPGADVEGTRQTAQLGFPLNNLLWGYRSGHSAQWEAWFDLVESDPRLTGADRRALLEAGSGFFFAYADRLTALVTDTYTAERERVLASREQRRVQLVRELLEGADVDAAALDYELAGEHLGLVAWGPDAAATVRELAGRSDRRLLLVPSLGEVWGRGSAGRVRSPTRGCGRSPACGRRSGPGSPSDCPGEWAGGLPRHTRTGPRGPPCRAARRGVGGPLRRRRA